VATFALLNRALAIYVDCDDLPDPLDREIAGKKPNATPPEHVTATAPPGRPGTLSQRHHRATPQKTGLD
jgi:hypothetical protein